eukprot:7127173-Alexandrium_andersonii.AAC.1
MGPMAKISQAEQAGPRGWQETFEGVGEAVWKVLRAGVNKQVAAALAGHSDVDWAGFIESIRSGEDQALFKTARG